MYVAGNSVTCRSVRVRWPMLHCNERIFVCSWPTLVVKFGYTELNDRYIVEQFLIISVKCWYTCKSFGDIRRNYSIMKLFTPEEAIKT